MLWSICLLNKNEFSNIISLRETFKMFFIETFDLRICYRLFKDKDIQQSLFCLDICTVVSVENGNWYWLTFREIRLNKLPAALSTYWAKLKAWSLRKQIFFRHLLSEVETFFNATLIFIDLSPSKHGFHLISWAIQQSCKA